MRLFEVCILWLVGAITFAEAQIYVRYKVEYTRRPCWGLSLKEVTVPIPVWAPQVESVLQGARNQYGRKYEYQAEFYGDLSITAVNGRKNTANCTWLIYITNPGEGEIKASLHDETKNGSLVTLRYSANAPDPGDYIRINYRIEYDTSCSSKRDPRPYHTDHFIYAGSAYQLMQKAVIDCKRQAAKNCNCSVDNYTFSVTYCPRGYMIDMIDNTPNDPRKLCYWTFYYIVPGHENTPFRSGSSPSGFLFLLDDKTVVMRYEKWAKKKQTCDA